jgi:hypothetical protein
MLQVDAQELVHLHVCAQPMYASWSSANPTHLGRAQGTLEPMA